MDLRTRGMQPVLHRRVQRQLALRQLALRQLALRQLALRHRTPRGFTLIELMVVMAIVAIVALGAVWALPPVGQQQLEREAQALIARLEVARARARASGQWVQAQIGPQGLQLQVAGHSAAQPLQPWLYARHSADRVQLLLGPEPVIPAQAVWLRADDGRALRIATDGVRPFALAVQP